MKQGWTCNIQTKIITYHFINAIFIQTSEVNKIDLHDSMNFSMEYLGKGINTLSNDSVLAH